MEKKLNITSKLNRFEKAIIKGLLEKQYSFPEFMYIVIVGYIISFGFTGFWTKFGLIILALIGLYLMNVILQTLIYKYIIKFEKLELSDENESNQDR